MNLTNLRFFWYFGYLMSDIVYLSFYPHVCLLCAVRYLITVYPLQSRQHLTVIAVCLCSLTIWISSGIAWVAKNLMTIISTITVGTIIFRYLYTVNSFFYNYPVTCKKKNQNITSFSCCNRSNVKNEYCCHTDH